MDINLVEKAIEMKIIFQLLNKYSRNKTKKMIYYNNRFR